MAVGARSFRFVRGWPQLARAGAGTLAPLVASSSLAQTAAAPAASVAGATMPELGASLLQMLFGLAVVIAALLACLWLLRRVSTPRGGQHLNVLSATSVGPRERVVLVEVGSRVLVLGVAPGRVSKLHELARDELPTTTPAAASTPGKGFANWLQQATERRNAR